MVELAKHDIVVHKIIEFPFASSSSSSSRHCVDKYFYFFFCWYHLDSSKMHLPNTDKWPSVLSGQFLLCCSSSSVAFRGFFGSKLWRTRRVCFSGICEPWKLSFRGECSEEILRAFARQGYYARYMPLLTWPIRQLSNHQKKKDPLRDTPRIISNSH